MDISMDRLVRVLYPDSECAIDGDHARMERCSGCLQWLAWMGVFEGSTLYSTGIPVVHVTKVTDNFKVVI